MHNPERALFLDPTRRPAVAEGPREHTLTRNLVKYGKMFDVLHLKRPATGE